MIHNIKHRGRQSGLLFRTYRGQLYSEGGGGPWWERRREQWKLNSLTTQSTLYRISKEAHTTFFIASHTVCSTNGKSFIGREISHHVTTRDTTSEPIKVGKTKDCLFFFNESVHNKAFLFLSMTRLTWWHVFHTLNEGEQDLSQHPSWHVHSP